MSNLDIRVAIEDWGLYNAGVLACKWWDTSDSLEDIQEYYEALREKHNVEPYDDLELFVADSEDWDFSEHESIEGVFETMETLEGLEDYELIPVRLYMENIEDDLESALDAKDDWISTGERDMSDVAYNFYQETQPEAVDSQLGFYVDWERVGRDMEIEGSYHTDAEGYIWEYTNP